MSHRTLKSVFNATARCSGCVCRRSEEQQDRHTHGEWTKTIQRGVQRPREGGSRGPVKAVAAQRRVKEILSKAVER